MLHITAQLYAKAIGCDYQTASRRLRKTSYIKGPNGNHLIALARAIPTLRQNERESLPALYRAASPIEVPPPPDAIAVALALEKWLEPPRRNIAFDAARTRLQNVKSAFAQTIADATESSALCRHTEAARQLLMLDDQIARYVLTGNQNALPADFRRHAMAFAILHMNPQADAIAA